MSKYKCGLCGKNHSNKRKNYCKLHDFWYEGEKCPRHVLAAQVGYRNAERIRAMKYKIKDILIDVEGGCVVGSSNVPNGHRLIVRDYDAKKVGDKWEYVVGGN